jgi:hypothetical protein
MRLFITVAILALLTGAAYAQKPDPGAAKWDPPPKVDEEAYRNAVKRIPEKTGEFDPWGSVRSKDKEKKKN